MSGLFALREFPHSAFIFPKQAVRTLGEEKWLKKKVPDKHVRLITES